MTLVELQAVLGKQIENLTDPREPFENKRRIAENALVVSSLAKQMINNADVVLRSIKFMADYKLEDETVKNMVTGKFLVMKQNEDGSLEGNEF
jgi:hypothetical protein